MTELSDQKEKYRALEQTWLAANQQFIAFQVGSLFHFFWRNLKIFVIKVSLIRIC